MALLWREKRVAEPPGDVYVVLYNRVWEAYIASPPLRRGGQWARKRVQLPPRLGVRNWLHGNERDHLFVDHGRHWQDWSDEELKVDQTVLCFRSNGEDDGMAKFYGVWNPLAEVAVTREQREANRVFARRGPPGDVLRPRALAASNAANAVGAAAAGKGLFATFRPPGWAEEHQFYLPIVRHDFVDLCVVTLDFGPYYEALHIAEGGAPQKVARLRAELLPDLEKDLCVGTANESTRFRTYATAEIHYRFNIVVVSAEEMRPNESLDWLTEGRAWEHNQVVVWGAPPGSDVATYVDTVRVALNKIDAVPEKKSDFLLWLHGPILSGLARERALIKVREDHCTSGQDAYAVRLLFDDQADPVHDPAFELDDCFSAQNFRNDDTAAQRLALRVHASVLALHNAMRREQRDAIPETADEVSAASLVLRKV